MRKNMLISACLLALPTIVAAGPFDNLAQVEVLPGWRNADGEHVAGLRITLEPGWKTYWRAPGDAGIPPQFSFNGSENINAVAPHFPVPEVFDQNGLRSIGYQNSVVFPMTVFGDNPDAPMQISGQIQIGVCEEICIPVSLDFSALLPPTGAHDGAIAAALVDQPMTRSEAKVGAVTCAIDQISDGLRVTATMDVAATGPSEVVVVEAGDAGVWVSEADVTRTGNQLRATVDMVNSTGTSFALDRSAVRITVLGGDQAIDIQGCSAN